MTTISRWLPDSSHERVKEPAERARRGERERFLQLLARAPDVEPDEQDRLPEAP